MVAEKCRQRLLRLEQPADIAEAKAQLPVCDDPVLFAEEYLGIKAWSRQAELLRAVAAHGRVVVKSGHKVGKSSSAAIVALWWFTTKHLARVILTSSSGRQVKEILWREVRALHLSARKPIGGSLALLPSTGLTASDGRQIVGFATDESEKMAGFSGPNILYIVDEASGVPEEVFDAIEGNMAGGAKLLMLSNPTQTIGKFYEAFHAKREFWHRLTISSEESPNITGEASIPGLAIRSWVDEMIRENGDPSPFVDVRIRGQFPTQSENAVIGVGLVEAATKEWREPTAEDGPLEVGVDVARFGDDETTIYPRRGKYCYKPTVLRSMDTIEVAGHVMRVVKDCTAGGKEIRKPRVKVDVIGVGAGVVDQLDRVKEIDVVGVNVSESATDEQYYRLRDQLWFATRDWLKDGGKFCSDAMLEAELVAPKYSFESRGGMKVESKDAIKKTLKRSPDRADGLNLSIYNPPKRARARATSYLDY